MYSFDHFKPATMKSNKNYKKSNKSLPGNHVTNSVYNGQNSRVSLTHYLDSVPPMTHLGNELDEQPETKDEEEEFFYVFDEHHKDPPSDSSTLKENDSDQKVSENHTVILALMKLPPLHRRTKPLHRTNEILSPQKSPQILQARLAPTLNNPIKITTGPMTTTVTHSQHEIYSTLSLNPQRSTHLPTWRTNINHIQTQ